jgi:transcriptional regulator with XRE-family HTH domain
MYLTELGHTIRTSRRAQGLTQGELAERVALSRTTVNQLENGVFPDIGVKKVIALLHAIGQDLAVIPQARKERPDFLRMAATSANVSYREQLSPETLARILLSGKVPPIYRPHLRVVLEELPMSVLKGVVETLATWNKRQKIDKNLKAIAEQVGSKLRVQAS